MALAVGYCSADDYNVASSILGSSTRATSCCSSYDPATTGGIVGATVAYTYSQGQNAAQQLAYGLNTAMILLGAFGVFCMQVGFATFVAGVIRAKNLASILLKSVIDTCISAICWYLLGNGFFGVVAVGLSPRGSLPPNAGNGFIGYSDFALTNMGSTPYDAQFFLWNWVFCAASTTIMVGSVAERCTFTAYVAYAIFYSSWVYPVYAHWSWANAGWLSPENPNSILGMGTIDFAGSGVVHTLGGFGALMGSIVLGPRVGRYDEKTKHLYHAGCTPQLYLLGTFFLWFGWFFFNSFSLLTIKNAMLADIVARTAVCTALAAAAGGIVACGLGYYRTHTWNMLTTCTGILGGLVAITSGCSVVEPWAAIICGGVAALFCALGAWFGDHFQIDDPAEAFAIHGLPGIWGMLFVGLLAKEQYVAAVYAKPLGQGYMGIFYGGHGQILLCNFIAVVCNICWVCFWMFPFFHLLNYLGVLRVSVTEEALGLDAAAMGAAGMNGGSSNTSLMDAKTPDPSSRFLVNGPAAYNPTRFGSQAAIQVAVSGEQMQLAQISEHGSLQHRAGHANA